jgi:ubiquinone/menaquinone biosynthesis C-methylase UbiE
MSQRDRVAFSSAQLPTEHFNARFSQENLAFWVPILIESAQIKKRHRVLDVGCGTGGFARAIAEVTSATVTGVDCSERFIASARDAPALEQGAVEWQVGSAEALSVVNGSFDCVLLSLVLHQLQHPERAVAEAFRVLAAGGCAVVRTVAPDDVARRVPYRFFPTMATTDIERLLPLHSIESWLKAVGFHVSERRAVLRNKKLNLADEEKSLLVEVHGRYPFVSKTDLTRGCVLCAPRRE